jgi:hypothetical protein
MKKIILVLVLFACLLNGFSQNNSDDGQTRSERNAEFRERPFKERLAFGGEVSMFFGNVTYINISPFIGYRINPDITFGIGPTYQYISVRNGTGYNTYRDNIFGGRAFLRHEFGRMFFAHAEYEVLNFNFYSQIEGWGRRNVDLASLGLGYKSSIGGEFAYYYVMILYDFIQNVNVRYVYPTAPLIFKVGFMFGK